MIAGVKKDMEKLERQRQNYIEDFQQVNFLSWSAKMIVRQVMGKESKLILQLEFYNLISVAFHHTRLCNLL